MHDYLQVFKHPRILKFLSEIRETYDIDPDLGTMSKSHIFKENEFPSDLVAGIQLYEYLFYDFIANEKIYSILNEEGKGCLNSVFKAIKSGALGCHRSKDIIVFGVNTLDLEMANYIISRLVDHKKYCDLYGKMAIPDYLAPLQDKHICNNLLYVKIQNGIFTKGLAAKPWLFDYMSPDMAASFQLYEYIFYDFLSKQEFHDSLNDTEKRHLLNIINAALRNRSGEPIDRKELAEDIEVANRCLSTRVDNSKFLELYNRSTFCPEENRMPINNIQHTESNPDADDFNHGLQKHKEYFISRKKAC